MTTRLMPYTVTALAESDADGTSGKNIVENAPITLTDLNDNPITMYDDAAELNPATTKYTNTDGYRVIWIQPGTYKLTVNSTLNFIEAALDSAPYGVGVAAGIPWPNGEDLTDFTDVFPWVNYTIDFVSPYTGTGLPSTLNGSDLNATLVYEGDLNGFGIFRLIDVATGDVWIKTWNNQVTQVDWQQIVGTQNTLDTQAFSVRDAMFSWWVGPKCIRYTDGTHNLTYLGFCDKEGSAGVIIHNHRTSVTKKYILNTDLNPDDHNASAVCVGSGKVAVVVGGRSNLTEPVDQCFLAEWDLDGEPFDASYTSYFVDVGRDYPEIYQIGNDVILIASQRGGTGGETTGHSFVTNTWPLGSGAGSWSTKVDLTDQTAVPDWMYLATRRNTDDPSIIDMAWGFHPTQQAVADIYKSQIRHVGGADPWRLYVNGVEIANLSTGVGLPIDLTDLELAYSAGVNERTRLYDVKGDQMVFTSYTDTGNPTSDKAAGEYYYLVKNGTWSSYKVADSGQAFLPASSTYYSGVTISEDGTLYCGRNVSGFYQFDQYTTSDSGVTWDLKRTIRYSNDNDTGTNSVHGRQVAEVPSLSTIERGDSINLQTVGWVGSFDRESFTNYYTAAVTLDPEVVYTPGIGEYQAATIGSVNSDTHGESTFVAATRNGDITGEDYQVILGCEDTQIQDRTRQVIAADSGSLVRTRNTFFGGTRNSTATGTNDVTGVTDTWILGAIGANASTIAKTYSFLGGVNDFDTGTAPSVTERCVVGLASETCTVNAGSNFVLIGASTNSDAVGNQSVILGCENCDVTQGAPSTDFYGGCYSSVDSSVTNAQSVVINSTGAIVSGTRALVAASEFGRATATSAVTLASLRTINPDAYTVAGGYSASGSPVSANRTWSIESITGDMYLAGTLTQSHTFADIAKMIKNGEGAEIEPGYLLTLIGDKVYKAMAGDSVDAIVAATPSAIHNDTPFAWQGRYLTDDFGRVITQKKPYVRWAHLNEPAIKGKLYPEQAQIRTVEINEGVRQEIVTLSGYDGPIQEAPEIPEWAEFYDFDEPIQNPEFDPDVENVKRSERPDEWTISGIHGFIRTRVDQTVTQLIVDNAANLRKNIYIKPGSIAGVGTLSEIATNVQVMRVEKEYKSGYGVALCYFKGSE